MSNPAYSDPVTALPERAADSAPRTDSCAPAVAVLTVPEQFRRQVALAPDAVALVAGPEQVTYAELDRQSEQLAWHLKSQGAGRDQLVGLYMERSIALVVGALAILKCGGAYVPLDPNAPVERLALQLRDAAVTAVLTRGGLASRLPSGNWKTVDFDAALSAGNGEAPSFEPIQPSHLAYVIYTSGSTGQPKGVEITHASLSNLVAWHLRAFSVTDSDRASLQAALGFDATVWELWPYLATGAAVHIPPDSLRNSPEALRKWLVAERITITFLPTALAERMLQIDWPRDTALRILLTGADALHHRPSARLPFQLINNYGPTECTVVATSGRVETAEAAKGTPSIGKAIDGATARILDENMRDVPAGSSGELYIGGACLARGYRNQAALTAERFVTLPQGERMYRTGDLARVLPSGEIEFLGRLDDQIKIRGYRIEPLEIVAALNAHPDISSSVVVAREDQVGEKRLIAYLVMRDDSQLTAAGVRKHLGARLPDYMVPASFVRMVSIPLTANGKADRGMLPAPDAGNTLRDGEFIEPATTVEKRLAAIIAPMLNVERIGLNDNFFFLGGHSLLGTQLITRIQEAFGVELSLLSLFDHPTIQEMAGEVEKLIFAKLDALDGQPVSDGPRG
jgi:amino acid adenylation domain-containing protein